MLNDLQSFGETCPDRHLDTYIKAHLHQENTSMELDENFLTEIRYFYSTCPEAESPFENPEIWPALQSIASVVYFDDESSIADENSSEYSKKQVIFISPDVQTLPKVFGKEHKLV